jgi:hypothetical protein
VTEFRLWTLSWLALCAALAFHVFEEAAYVRAAVPAISILRDLFPWLPHFSYEFWLFNNVGAVIVLSALAWQVHKRNPLMRPASYAFALFALVTAMFHSLWVPSSGSPMAPWMTAAPFLLAASLLLLLSIPRGNLRRPNDAPDDRGSLRTF